MWPTWGPPGSCRPQVDPMLAQWTLLSGPVSAGGFSIGLITAQAWHITGGLQSSSWRVTDASQRKSVENGECRVVLPVVVVTVMVVPMVARLLSHWRWRRSHGRWWCHWSNSRRLVEVGAIGRRLSLDSVWLLFILEMYFSSCDIAVMTSWPIAAELLKTDCDAWRIWWSLTSGRGWVAGGKSSSTETGYRWLVTLFFYWIVLGYSMTPTSESGLKKQFKELSWSYHLHFPLSAYY